MILSRSDTNLYMPPFLSVPLFIISYDLNFGVLRNWVSEVIYIKFSKIPKTGQLFLKRYASQFICKFYMIIRYHDNAMCQLFKRFFGDQMNPKHHNVRLSLYFLTECFKWLEIWHDDGTPWEYKIDIYQIRSQFAENRPSYSNFGTKIVQQCILRFTWQMLLKPFIMIMYYK